MCVQTARAVTAAISIAAAGTVSSGAPSDELVSGGSVQQVCLYSTRAATLLHLKLICLISLKKAAPNVQRPGLLCGVLLQHWQDEKVILGQVGAMTNASSSGSDWL